MIYSREIVGLMIATSAVLINDIIAKTYVYFVKFNKLHTLLEQKSIQFRYTVIMEFINMGLMAIITSFTTITKILSGRATTTYFGFESEWFMNVGR